MTLEKTKRAFVKYIEETRRGDPYPRNFMGCLISILTEPKPISQERIMELTGYSQATISLTLQKIQLLMPVKTVMKRGDRKRYYTYDGSPESFILDLWEKRLEVQGFEIIQIEASIERVKERTGEGTAVRRFIDYLFNMQLYLTLIHSLRSSSIEQFRKLLKTDFTHGTDAQDTQDSGILKKSEIEEFLEELRTNTTTSKSEEEPVSEYLLLKNEYFSGMKANLNPLYSQTIANQMMVLHDVFLERSTTQEMIEKSTLLPRSTISELLSQFVKLGVIKVTKKDGTRIKLYQPAISFTDFMLSYSERLAQKMIGAKAKLSKFISATRKISPKSQEVKKFQDVLESFLKAYLFTEDFTKGFKAKMVTRLKQSYDHGFVFI
ncbi:MAG: hypothetical protein KAR33_06390 [Candidatus Thorarchaeota archaeon]|nr:hypothetical protein [Candidatus Thorarchaeota archaeon]